MNAESKDPPNFVVLGNLLPPNLCRETRVYESRCNAFNHPRKVQRNHNPSTREGNGRNFRLGSVGREGYGPTRSGRVDSGHTVKVSSAS